MKKFLKSIVIISIFVFMIILFKKYYFKDYKIDLKNNDMSIQLKYKGLDHAVDFIVDKYDNYYIAYKNKIQYINKNGESSNIFKDKNLNINSIDYYKNKIYFSSDKSLYCYNIKNKKCEVAIGNIPNFGDYKSSIVKINGDKLYLTIGAVTNSGVVGNDNKWIKNNPFSYDISPYKIILNGINFDNGKSGAFTTYSTKTVKNQVVPGHFPGNASILMYDLKNTKYTTYAWGIRNVTGIDFDSKGRMIASIGGMENRGLRPIKGDNDYIYLIENGKWYGWPDYSGGDPITSPKFKGNNNKLNSFILVNHPTTNPSAPLYVHKNLATLKGMAVDKNGSLGEVDNIYFYDSKEKKIYSLDINGVLKQKIQFKDSNVRSIKYVKDKILILDSHNGNIYSIGSKNLDKKNASVRPLIYFSLISIIMIIIMLLKKIINSSNKHK